MSASLSLKQILERLIKNQNELIDISKITKIENKEENIEILQKEINIRIKKMTLDNHCDELFFSIEKNYFYLVSIFEENEYLFFSNSGISDKNSIKNNIIQEYKNISSFLTREDEKEFFTLFFINRNLKESLLNFHKDNGDSIKFTFEVINELLHEN